MNFKAEVDAFKLPKRAPSSRASSRRGQSTPVLLKEIKEPEEERTDAQLAEAEEAAEDEEEAEQVRDEHSCRMPARRDWPVLVVIPARRAEAEGGTGPANTKPCLLSRDLTAPSFPTRPPTAALRPLAWDITSPSAFCSSKLCTSSCFPSAYRWLPALSVAVPVR